VAKILIVDDEYANRLLVTTVLRHAGYATREAADASEAVRIARDELPDLVLVDLGLGTNGGAQLIRSLRADPATKSLRIALYTATRLNPALEDFMRVHAIDRIIPKPSAPEELLSAVKQCFREQP